jgi:EPS-associated MarR family transcriptional regulator|tara:strand:+ start:514 stop:822 length:309 start_codon:yes stop_codon:yes gene_type:complete
MDDNQDHLNILRSLDNEPKLSQRKLAKNLGFSLGKLNYCLKALKDKGLIKIQNFQKKEKKIQYFQYIITPEGIAERTRLTINFMKRKMKEYDELRQELEKKD